MLASTETASPCVYALLALALASVLLPPMIAMLPRSMVAAQLASGQFKELRSPLHVPALEYGVVTRKDEPLSASARAFVEILLEGAKQRQKEGTAATALDKT